MPFDLTPAEAPRDLPTPAHDSERLVRVGPFEGRGETLADRWVDALTSLAKALAAEKAGPPHLATLTVRAVDPQAVLAFDPWLLELLYREALGGNFCDSTLVEDSAYSLAVEGAALVPPPPTGPPRDLVKGGVLVSGLFELEPVRLTGVNHAVGMDADMARRNSPVLMAPAYEGMPLAVAAGAEESDEFQRQSRDLAEAWEKAGAKIDFMALDGCNHFTALEALGDPASPLGARAMKLIAAV